MSHWQRMYCACFMCRIYLWCHSVCVYAPGFTFPDKLHSVPVIQKRLSDVSLGAMVKVTCWKLENVVDFVARIWFFLVIMCVTANCLG